MSEIKSTRGHMKQEYRDLMKDILSQHRAGLDSENASKCLAIIADCAEKQIPAEDVPEKYREWSLW